MALTNEFYEAVKSGDVLSVRIMMQNSLLMDLSFATFDAMEKAAASMEGLYDEHDGKELIEDKSLWNDKYMNRVMVKVLSNFSHERIEHLKEVVSYIETAVEESSSGNENTPGEESAPHKESVPHKEPVRKEIPREERQTRRNHDDYAGAKIGVAAITGAAVGGAIASVAGASVAGVMSGVAIGAVIGGVSVAILVNGGRK